ncbi:hypothetical protein NC652_013049 [Populus alba x Populus x berolinensis]|nr:hypothetical protein NC652_013049 [Populus alba x Populus x berolinensis]
MGSYKAPGKDGIQPLFFKQYWYVMGDDVWDPVRSAFVQYGSFDSDLSETLIVLIPKEERRSTTFKQFRLISLCIVIYKTLFAVDVHIEEIENNIHCLRDSVFLDKSGLLWESRTVIASGEQTSLHGSQILQQISYLAADFHAARETTDNNCDLTELDAVTVQTFFQNYCPLNMVLLVAWNQGNKISSCNSDFLEELRLVYDDHTQFHHLGAVIMDIKDVLVRKVSIHASYIR